MAYEYDVQYVPEQPIRHADAMLRLRFKEDGNDLVAFVSATFKNAVIKINFLQEEMATNHFSKRINATNLDRKMKQLDENEKKMQII